MSSRCLHRHEDHKPVMPNAQFSPRRNGFHLNLEDKLECPSGTTDADFRLCYKSEVLLEKR